MLSEDQTIQCYGNDGGTGKVNDAPGVGRYTAITVAANHSCALRADQQIICWGGRGSSYSITPPTGQYIDVSAGGLGTCAIRNNQQLVCWGSWRHPLFPADTPAGMRGRVPPGTFKQLAKTTNGSYACAIRTNDTVACFGLSPPQLAGTYHDIAVGKTGVCGIRLDGSLQCQTMPAIPVTPVTPGQYQTLAVDESLCAIGKDQSLVCSGDSSPYQ